MRPTGLVTTVASLSSRQWVPWMIGGLCLAIAILDFVTPLGLSVSMLYLLPMALSMGIPRPWPTRLLGALCIALVLWGFQNSAPGGVPFNGIINRSLTIVLLIVSVVLIEQFTRRKAAEQGFQVSDQFYRLMIDAVSDYAILMLNPDGTVASWNNGARRIKQYADDEIMGQHYSVFYLPEDIAQGTPDRLLQQASAQGRVEDEGWRTRKDGSQFWANVIITALHDQTGNLQGFLKVTRDLTQRKQAEKALREREASNISVLNSLSSQIVELNSQGVIIAVNKPWLRFAEENGAPHLVESFVGMNYLNVCAQAPKYTHGVEAAAAQAGILAVLAGTQSEFSLEYPCHSPDQQRWFCMHVTPMLDSQAGVVIAHENITERKRVEDALREREEALARFKHTLDQTHDSVFIFSSDTLRFIYCNQGAITQVGYSEAELFTMTPLDIKPDFTPEQFQALLQPLREGRQSSLTFETLHRHKDGHDIPVEVTLQLVQQAGEVPRYVAIVRDITAHKLATAALFESEQRFASLLTTVPGVVWELDLTTFCFTFVSAQAERLLGYPAQQWLNDPSFWADHLHPEDRDQALAFCLAQTNLGLDHQFEYRMCAADGRTVWIKDLVCVFRQSGCPVVLRGIMVDITAQKLAEERLREGDVRFRAIFDQTFEFIGVMKPDGTLIEANRTALQLSGVREEDVLGKKFWDTPWWAHSPELQDRVREAVRSAAGGTMVRFEATHPSPTGELAHVDFSLKPVHDEQGKVIFLIPEGRDITERKQAETIIAAQVKALVVFKAALDAHAIVAITDQTGRISYVNDKFCQISGYTREELQGQDHRLLNSGYHPKAFIKELWHTIANGKVWSGEIQNRAKDGSRYWVATTIVPSFGADTKPNQYIAIRADITARKQAETVIASQVKALASTNLTLVEANRSALAATQAKSEFLASMSHEIRTPMNAIIGMADLLQETTLTTEQQDYVQRFSRAATSLTDLINDILDLTKVEAGQLELELVPFNLVELVDKTAELMAVRASAKALELVAFVHPEVPPFVMGDPTRLRQVLVNLLGNAIKFTERGEVILRIDPVGSDAGIHTLRFSVSDTGIGIPADKLQTIFERFTQVDASTTRQYGGTGLGLSISKRIIELMESHIDVASKEGQGSTLSFVLPMVAVPGVETTPEPPSIALQGYRMLVVDDNETNRMIVREFLSRMGVILHEAQDGPTALAALDDAQRRGEPFQLAILDLQMPGMSGLELAQAIRSRPAFATLPLVLHASDMHGHHARRAREFGIVSYLHKPISRTRLLASLTDALRPTAAQVAPSTPQPKSQPALADLRPLHILLAEDLEDNRDVVALFLKETPYKLDMAENGAVALEKFCTGTYDLLLMDIQMPIMDGYQATEAIRQWEREQQRAPTPIVAFTANAFKEDFKVSLAVGCMAHLTKPLRKQALLTCILEHTGQTPGHGA